MALPRASSQIDGTPAQITPPRRYCPRSLSIHSRRRFNHRRRAEYMTQIAGRPSQWQVAAIESLIRREWIAITAERSDDPDAALRADREYQKLLADFRRSLAPAAAKPPTIADLAEQVRREREHAA